MRRARASGWRRQAAMASALPARIPACGPPRSLSPEKHDEVAAVAQGLARERLAGQLGGLEQRARADVEDEREPRFARDPHQLGQLDVAGEAEHPVIGRVHAQDRARLGAERARVVGRAGAIGRADLAQARARALHDLGDAEAVADLDELTARDDDLAPAPERCKREHECRCAVVDADRRFRAGQLAHECRDVILPPAAPARGEVELQVRVARRDGLHALERGVRERRAAEVRVQDDAGGVEHRTERWFERCPHAPAQLGRERRRGGVLAAGSPFGERRARLAHAQRVRRIARGFAHEQVDGWQRAGHAPYRTAVAAGEVVAQTRGTLPFWEGAATFDRVQGARPRQRHAGAWTLSVDDAARARAMRLYGRQSRVRARRRRVLMTLGVIVALLAIPCGHLVLQRGSVTQGVRVAGVPLGGASRAEAEREITAALGDQLRREVTVTVAGRSATLSPYDLGVRVDAERTASAALAAGRVRGGLLFSVGYSRSIDPLLKYPATLALPVELADVTQSPVDAKMALKPSGAAIVTPAKPGVGFDPDEALRVIARAALAERGQVSLRTVPTEAAISTAAARRAKLRVAQLLSAPIAFTRRGQPAGNWPIRRLAPLLTADDLQARDRRQVRPGQGGCGAAPAALGLHAPGARRALEGGREEGARALLAERRRPRRTHDGAAHDEGRRPGRDAAYGGAGLPRHPARADDRRGARARRHGRRQRGHDRPRRVVRPTASTTCTAREAPRRHDREAGRDVLVQRDGRPAHRRARVQGGSRDRRRPAPALHRRRRLPGRDHGLRRRLLRRLPITQRQ